MRFERRNSHTRTGPGRIKLFFRVRFHGPLQGNGKNSRSEKDLEKNPYIGANKYRPDSVIAASLINLKIFDVHKLSNNRLRVGFSPFSKRKLPVRRYHKQSVYYKVYSIQ